MATLPHNLKLSKGMNMRNLLSALNPFQFKIKELIFPGPHIAALLFVIVFVVMISLSGCSTISENAPSIKNQVALAQETFITAESLADFYKSWPLCGKPGSPAKPACADIKNIIMLGGYREHAFAALKAARVAEDQTTLAAAITAVNAFRDVTAPYKPLYDASHAGTQTRGIE